MGFKKALPAFKLNYLIGTDHMIWLNREHLRTWLVNKSNTTRFYAQFRYHYDAHPQVRNEMPPKHSTPQTQLHSNELSHGPTPT